MGRLATKRVLFAPPGTAPELDDAAAADSRQGWFTLALARSEPKVYLRQAALCCSRGETSSPVGADSDAEQLGIISQSAHSVPASARSALWARHVGCRSRAVRVPQRVF